MWHVVITHMHWYLCRPVDVDECVQNNGGCDSKRKCTNTVGGHECGDCPVGWSNDGATGCKGWLSEICLCALMRVLTWLLIVKQMHPPHLFVKT